MDTHEKLLSSISTGESVVNYAPRRWINPSARALKRVIYHNRDIRFSHEFLLGLEKEKNTANQTFISCDVLITKHCGNLIFRNFFHKKTSLSLIISTVLNYSKMLCNEKSRSRIHRSIDSRTDNY